jgi:hypothetical protein
MNNLSKEDILEIGRNGKICEVFNHKWLDTTPNIIYPTNPPQRPLQQRKCEICGKVQIKKEPKWENKQYTENNISLGEMLIKEEKHEDKIYNSVYISDEFIFVDQKP